MKRLNEHICTIKALTITILFLGSGWSTCWPSALRRRWSCMRGFIKVTKLWIDLKKMCLKMFPRKHRDIITPLFFRRYERKGQEGQPVVLPSPRGCRVQEQRVRAEARDVERRQRGLAVLHGGGPRCLEAAEASEPDSSRQRHRVDEQRAFSVLDEPRLPSSDPVWLQARPVRRPGRDADGSSHHQEDPGQHVQETRGEPDNQVALAFKCYSFFTPWHGAPWLGHDRFPSRSYRLLRRTLPRRLRARLGPVPRRGGRLH